MSAQSNPPAMTGKTVLITGANSGLGLASARALARRGAKVLMLCRDERRGSAAQAEIESVSRGGPPVLFLADLASQRSILAVARDVRARFPRIDVLMNNAGAIFAERELTADGVERTFAVNHLAPFLLTNLLLEPLLAAPQGRVVTVAADPFVPKLDFDNLQSEKGHNFLTAYFRSKLANILFTYELARRLKGAAVTANCLSPGPTLTKFGDNLHGAPALVHLLLGPLKRIPGLFASADKGAETQVYLASSPELATVSGRFFFRGREKSTDAIVDEQPMAARLWRLSEELCSASAASAAA